MYIFRKTGEFICVGWWDHVCEKGGCSRSAKGRTTQRDDCRGSAKRLDGQVWSWVGGNEDELTVDKLYILCIYLDGDNGRRNGMDGFVLVRCSGGQRI
jgi:hypothetical protein